MKMIYSTKNKHYNYRCFLDNENKLIFDTTVDGERLKYTIVGYPDKKILFAKCNIPIYSFVIRDGLYFPQNTDATGMEEVWDSICWNFREQIVTYRNAVNHAKQKLTQIPEKIFKTKNEKNAG